MNVRLSVEERFWTKVQKTDTCWMWAGSDTGWSGYGSFWLDGKLQLAHRVSHELHHGPIPSGMEVDHVCHNRLCVRPDHLRLASHKQNNENHQGARRDSTCGVRGVTWHKKGRKWQAMVRHNGRDYYCGLFSTLEDAEAAVIAKRNELFTHNDLDRMESDA